MAPCASSAERENSKMSEKMYLHPITERIWHWVHALLVMVLIISGIQIHWPGIFGKFSNAITVHNWAGILLVCDFFLWLLYNLISKRVSHYILRKEDIHPGMIVQARFYAYDIFKNKPHPYAPSEDNKFNPLQKATYFNFMFFMMPLLLISGILYMYPSHFSSFIAFLGGLKVVALFHYVMAIIFAAFFVAHIYLATTGHTVFSDFVTMVTGYADKEEH
jgi:thiosulfate reductase cytochrome b subunit